MAAKLRLNEAPFMPTYDYECDACHHKFEEFQGFSEPQLKKCPQCKKPKLRRLIGTGAAVVFKGSGFYETDYRSESYKAAAKADQEKAAAPAADKPVDTNGTAATKGTTDTAKQAKSEGGTKSKEKTSKSKG
jgi:putative FmdB family regulatory protein